MTKSYFKMMTGCFFASFAILTVAALIDLNPLLAMLGALAPLAYYHIGFLAPQAHKGLSQTAIDSVYYFGFLVTVAALGISAMSIARGAPGQNINLIVYQFGIGLIATGYAVIARLHLSSMSAMVNEASPEALMDRYVKRSVELVTNVEMASDQLAAFSTKIVQQTTETSEATRLATQQAILESARTFQDEMRSMLASAKDSLTTIRGLVSETSFVAERKELVASMTATVAATTGLTRAIDELSAKTKAGAETAQASAERSAEVEQALASFSVQISQFGGERGVFVTASETLLDTSRSLEMCNISMADAAVGLAEIANTVGDTGPTFKAMRTLTKKAGEQLEGLVEVCIKLESAGEQLASAAMASDSLAAGISKVTSAFSPLALTTADFNEKLSSAAKSASCLQEHIGAMPNHTAKLREMGEDVADALDQICEVIEDAVKHAATLASHTQQSSQSAEAAHRLLPRADAIASSISAFQNTLSGLTESVSTWQKAINESSVGITTSIAKSNVALENDVKRSAAAASMLTEKLVKVAETIIERTRAPEHV
jgi:hypothetical protein